jgi:t-SNARE complex subunit (syntaxin)
VRKPGQQLDRKITEIRAARREIMARQLLAWAIALVVVLLVVLPLLAIGGALR